MCWWPRITDTPTHSGAENFDINFEHSSEVAKDIVLKLLKEMKLDYAVFTNYDWKQFGKFLSSKLRIKSIRHQKVMSFLWKSIKSVQNKNP